MSRVGMMMACLLLAAALAMGQEDYRREVVCSIPIGNGMEQLAVGDGYGPAQLMVRRDGMLYFADTGNGRVKAFDARGQFVMQTGLLAHPPRSFALDAYRNILVLDGPDRIVEFSPVGQVVYALPLPAEMPAAQQLFASFDDAICVRRDAQTLGVIEQRGEFQHILPGNLCTEGRQVVSMIRQGDDAWSFLFRSMTLGGRLLQTYPLKMKPGNKFWLIEQDIDPSRIDWVVDAGGYTHMVIHLDRIWSSPPKKRAASTDLHVISFNAAGEQVHTARFPAPPFPMSVPVAVDARGNLYHLAVRDQVVDVVRERLRTPRVQPAATLQRREMPRWPLALALLLIALTTVVLIRRQGRYGSQHV